MLDKLSEPNYKPNPKLVEVLDKCFILHADHELNCSTATMRQVLMSSEYILIITSFTYFNLYSTFRIVTEKIAFYLHVYACLYVICTGRLAQRW